jgi:gamma-glutamyl-gamma-aminobutyrate hydrolase PuuD
MVQKKVKAVRLILLSVLLAGVVLEMEAQRRPLIGVADASRDGKNATVPRLYIDAVLQAGGIPVVIPAMYEEKKVIELLHTVDGIIFVGGGDFDPAYYNERPIAQMGKINVSRDAFEMKLVYLAAEHSMPILGICRGLQLINIAFGGSLYQDLPTQYNDKRIRHQQQQPYDEASHAVYVEPHTVFSGIVKDRRLMVNSSHHQAIKKVAHGFRVAGKSPDNIVEVIEKVDDNNWILGVQFHPEARVTKDHAMHLIFQHFIDEAARREKPDRTVKTASAPQAGRKSGAASQVTRAQVSEPVSPPPQIMHKHVTDTTLIYKFIRDTQYIQAPMDTVYLSVPDIKYVQLPADTVYVRDTTYIAVSPEAANRASHAPWPSSVSDPSSVPVVDQPAIGALKSTSDTLLLTPGTLDSTTVSTHPNTSRSKQKEAKAKMRKELKAAEKLQQQQQKEELAKARQQEKELKEKNAQEKKAAEKLQQQQQKKQLAKARQQEKELKEKNAQEKKAAEKLQQQQQKEELAKARQQEKELKEKNAQEKKAAEKLQQQQQKEELAKARQQEKELKEKNAQEKKAAEKLQQQQQKEELAKARQQEKELKEKNAQELKAAEKLQQQQQKEELAKARQQKQMQKEKRAREKKRAKKLQQQQQKAQLAKARQQKKAQKAKKAQEKKAAEKLQEEELAKARQQKQAQKEKKAQEKKAKKA